MTHRTPAPTTPLVFRLCRHQFKCLIQRALARYHDYNGYYHAGAIGPVSLAAIRHVQCIVVDSETLDTPTSTVVTPCLVRFQTVFSIES